MNIPSQEVIINSSAEKVYRLISNCNHIGKYLPSQVKNFESHEEHCSFTIENIATITLRIVEKQVHTMIKYQAENDKNLPCFIYFHIGDSVPCTLKATVEIEVPFFVKGMIEKPMQQFVQVLVDKIKYEAENNGI